MIYLGFADPLQTPRLFELSMAFALLSSGFWVVIFPESFKHTAFSSILEIFGPMLWAAIYLIIGAARLLALFINGRWPYYGPWVRSFCAIAASGVWLQMVVGLIISARVVPSIGVPLFATLALTEFFAAYRALGEFFLLRRLALYRG